MILLKIFDVIDNVPLSVLKAGVHIIGRDTFNKNQNRSISRKHAKINIDDKGASLTSIHVNPCYYKSKNSERVEILFKDVPKVLTDGDKFAFSRNEWYRIEIIDSITSEIPNRKYEPTENSQAAENSDAASSLTSEPSTQITNVHSTCSDTVDSDKSGSSSIEPTRSPLKRTLEELTGGNTKRIKTIHESLDELLNNINQITESDKNKNKTESATNVTTKEVYKKNEELDDSNDEDDSNNDASEITVDNTIITSTEKGKSAKKDEDVPKEPEGNNDGQQKGESSDILNDLNKEPIDNNANEVKEEVSDSDKEDNELDIKPSPVELQKNDDEDQREEDDDNASSVREDSGPSGSSSSRESIGNKLRRDRCWYGGSCYRKSLTHRTEFSHPGDPDYEFDAGDAEPSSSSRPVCSYGAQCYRTNRQHRNAYSHPTKRPAPKPSPDSRNNNKKRRKNYAVDSDEENSDASEDNNEASSDIDSSIGERVRKAAIAARKAKEIGNEEEDEDDDEPFEDDGSSSENYEANDSDSDFSDPNAEEDREEVETFVEEAKRFLRKKSRK